MRVKYICEAHGYMVYNSSSGDFITTASLNVPVFESDDPEIGDFQFGVWNSTYNVFTPD
jgi:hypothetical protein